MWSSELNDAAEAELLMDLFQRVGSAYSESTREGPELFDERRGGEVCLIFQVTEIHRQELVVENDVLIRIEYRIEDKMLNQHTCT